MKQIRGYIFSRPFLDERVPQNVQNLVIREFCKKENLFYNLSASEYAMINCYKILNQLIHELKDLDGIVENLKLSKHSELKKIENIWLIKKSLPSCLKNY